MLNFHAATGRRLALSWSEAKNIVRDTVLDVVGLPSKPDAARYLGAEPGEYTIEDWREDMARRHPVRYWLLEDVPLWLRLNIRQPIVDAWYWLRTHTVHRYHMLDTREPKNGYAWGWCDRKELLIFAAFAVLRDFVEKERPFERVNWDWNEDHQRAASEICALYGWWICGRAVEHREYDEALAGFSLDGVGTPESRARLDRLNEIEEKLSRRDEEMLGRLAKIRGYLWT